MNSVLQILQQMELSKKEKKIVPSAILYNDLLSECIRQGHQKWLINNELRKLKDSKEITTYRTINNIAISWQRKN